MIRLSSTVLTVGYFALITIFSHRVESLYWGGIRNNRGVRNLFAFTGESTAGVAACSDADLVSCRRISVDLEALLEDDRLFVPGVGVIDKTRPDPETVDEFEVSYVEYQLEEGPDGKKRRKKKVNEGIGQITFASAPQSTASTSSCHQPHSATVTYDSDRGSVVGAIGDAHSVENCGPGTDLSVEFASFGISDSASDEGCHVFKTYDKAIVLVVEWNF